MSAPTAAPPPTEPRQRAVQSIGRNGYHNVAFDDWGDPASPETVYCIHGLTRNGRDFSALARRLSEAYRVICPDLVGRGRSDPLPDPTDYHLLQYNLDFTVLTASAGTERFDYIGTSLGGLMGIALAGLPNSPIRRLIINDIAPEVPLPAIRRLNRYIGKDFHFENYDEVEAHLRDTLSTFAPMTDTDWAQLARTSVVESGSGYAMAYDRGIERNIQLYTLMTFFSLWRYWERIACPVLILRGAESDFLTGKLLAKMIDRLPHADVLEFEGVGHVPTLNAPVQIDPVVEWLSQA